MFDLLQRKYGLLRARLQATNPTPEVELNSLVQDQVKRCLRNALKKLFKRERL